MEWSIEFGNDSGTKVWVIIQCGWHNDWVYDLKYSTRRIPQLTWDEKLETVWISTWKLMKK